MLLAESAERLVAVARLHDPVAVPLERVREQRLDRVLVVDEEDGRSARHRSGRAGPQARGAPTIAPRWKRLGPGTRGRRLRRGTVEGLSTSRLVRVGFARRRSLRCSPSCSPSRQRERCPARLSSRSSTRHAAPPRRAARSRPNIPSRVPGSRRREPTPRAGTRQTIRGVRSRRRGGHLARRRSPTSEPSQLQNVVDRHPGRSDADDRRRCSSGQRRAPARTLGDNASGTAALIELARGFAPQEHGRGTEAAAHARARVDRRRERTGAPVRSASRRPRRSREAAFAVVVLDGLGGDGHAAARGRGRRASSRPPERS